MDIAGYIDVQEVCAEFRKMQYYIGAVEIALTAAEQIDPTNIALEIGKTDDPAARELYEKRKKYYYCVLEVLEELLKPPAPQVSAPLLNASNQASKQAKKSNVSNEERNTVRRAVFQKIQSSKDKLFHETLYEWYLNSKMENELLTVCTSILNNIFLRAVTNHVFGRLPKIQMPRSKFALHVLQQT